MSRSAGVERMDWSSIAWEVRGLRMTQGYSQDDLARRSGLAPKTIYRLERGLAVSRGSLLKVCKALEVLPEQLCALPMPPPRPVYGVHHLYGVHRHGESVWFMIGGDLRVRVPEDNFERTQRREERLRLGRQGLVAAFGCSLSFMMPEGPGIVTLELFGRLDGSFNATVYRECVLSCARGGVRVGVGDDIVELVEGEALGYRSKDLRWMEPLVPTDNDGLPTTLTWTGAVRVGNLPGESRKGERVKRTKRDG